MEKSSKTTAIIAAVALVALLAIAFVAYNALTGGFGQSSSASQTAASGASEKAGAASSTSSASSPASNASSSSSARAVKSDSVYASLETEFLTIDSETVSWSDLSQGKPIVVNFWATWCPYCVQEMDDFQALYDEFGDDVVFVMMDACDGRRETRDKAENYIYENQYTFPVYFDITGEVGNEFGVTAYPSTIVFNAEGDVEYAAAGKIDAKNMRSMLKFLL